MKLGPAAVTYKIRPAHLCSVQWLPSPRKTPLSSSSSCSSELSGARRDENASSRCCNPASRSLDAFLVFSADAHQSEYVADYDKRRAFLSDFQGSAGTAVVTQKEAALWTDGRYFNQASSELSSHWILMKSGQPGVPELGAWLSASLSRGQVVGVDPTLISAKAARDLQTALAASHITLAALTFTQPNPIDLVWDAASSSSASPRPVPPRGVARVHPVEYSGENHHQKLLTVQQLLRKKGAHLGVISALDEIAWLFNLRGSDVTFNPVVKAYAVVLSGLDDDPVFHDLDIGDGKPATKKQKMATASGDVFLFMEEYKVTEEVSAHLLSGKGTEDSVNIILKPYHEVTTFLSQYLQAGKGAKKLKVSLDGNSLNWGVYESVQGVVGAEVLDAPSVVSACKTIKNPVEREGIRACHVRDGVALTAFLSWLDAHMASTYNSLSDSGEKENAISSLLSEHEAAVKLESFRAAMPLYVSPSFDTISSYGSNGAVIHYHPPRVGSAPLGHSSLYLLDSGGQYLDGTTDVTRTLYFGPCEFEEESARGKAAAQKFREMRDAFTHVLKAHIALATAKFPEDTLGYRLDAITRAPLWAAGMDYAHGTGHGVGAFLNVHEGPQGIGIRPRQGDMGFKEGMTTSNEPGYYKDGEYGIRIENVCLTVAVPNSAFPMRSGGVTEKQFLELETVTMCPLDRCLVNTSLLSATEVQWVDSYHSRVRDALLPPMTAQFPEAVQYLLRNTEPLR